MTGSVALDVVIGLVFIYLLYSLLATVVCEIIALHLGLRARNLHYAIRRMLEDNPETSENKLIALPKHVWGNFTQLLHYEEGPAACVFYSLPIIKYLAQNTYYSRPSYITRQNFSKAMIEIFRRYGGTDEKTDLEKIQNVLKGALEYPGVLRIIKDEINRGTTVNDLKLDKPRDFVKIYDTIKEKATAADAEFPLDAAQRKLVKKINALLKPEHADNDKKAIVYKIDEILNLFGHETRSHLSSLLKDSNNDLVKFKLHLEQWFDDTMNRATDWYKQKIQFVLLLVGLTFAICFNANTLVIIKKLSIDKDARDKLVQLVSDYVNDSKNALPNTNGDVLNDSIRTAKLDSLQKIQAKLQRQMDEANSLLGLGWEDLPDSLNLLPWTKNNEDSIRKLNKEGLVGYSIIAIDKPQHKDTLQPNYILKIITYPIDITAGILGCLDERDYFRTRDVYLGFNSSMTKIRVDNSAWGNFLYILSNTFSHAFWGYLLTALAISLGAPFWFDLLNKLMQVRGAVREPTKTQANEPSAASSLSDPAHLINRKG